MIAETTERLTPEPGKKLDYILGKAMGSSHNIQRSQSMLRSLEKIGLHDNASTREYLVKHFTDVLNDPTNIIKTQTNGRVVRESLLMGLNGGVKIETIWEGGKLITMKIFGG